MGVGENGSVGLSPMRLNLYYVSFVGEWIGQKGVGGLVWDKGLCVYVFEGRLHFLLDIQSSANREFGSVLVCWCVCVSVARASVFTV